MNKTQANIQDSCGNVKCKSCTVWVQIIKMLQKTHEKDAETKRAVCLRGNFEVFVPVPKVATDCLLCTLRVWWSGLCLVARSDSSRNSGARLGAIKCVHDACKIWNENGLCPASYRADYTLTRFVQLRGKQRNCKHFVECPRTVSVDFTRWYFRALWKARRKKALICAWSMLNWDKFASQQCLMWCRSLWSYFLWDKKSDHNRAEYVTNQTIVFVITQQTFPFLFHWLCQTHHKNKSVTTFPKQVLALKLFKTGVSFFVFASHSLSYFTFPGHRHPLMLLFAASPFDPPRGLTHVLMVMLSKMCWTCWPVCSHLWRPSTWFKPEAIQLSAEHWPFPRNLSRQRGPSVPRPKTSGSLRTENSTCPAQQQTCYEYVVPLCFDKIGWWKGECFRRESRVLVLSEISHFFFKCTLESNFSWKWFYSKQKMSHSGHTKICLLERVVQASSVTPGLAHRQAVQTGGRKGNGSANQKNAWKLSSDIKGQLLSRVLGEEQIAWVLRNRSTGTIAVCIPNDCDFFRVEIHHCSGLP